MKNETELLQECKLQLEYLNEKFGETGTTNALLVKINTVLQQVNVKPTSSKRIKSTSKKNEKGREGFFERWDKVIREM